VAPPGPAGGAHSAAPDSVAEFRGGGDGRGKWQGKGRARGYVKGRREEGREEKDGEGRKKAKESRVVPHPKLNPGCATEQVATYEQLNTSSIWRGRKMNGREREVGNVGADLGGVYQGLRGLSLLTNCSLSEKN